MKNKLILTTPLFFLLFSCTSYLKTQKGKLISNNELHYFDKGTILYATDEKHKSWKPSDKDLKTIDFLLGNLIIDNKLDYIDVKDLKEKLLLRIVFYIKDENKMTGIYTGTIENNSNSVDKDFYFNNCRSGCYTIILNVTEKRLVHFIHML